MSLSSEEVLRIQELIRQATIAVNHLVTGTYDGGDMVTEPVTEEEHRELIVTILKDAINKLEGGPR